MNETFKNQLAAFARDLNALCNMNARCSDCPYRNKNGWCAIGINGDHFDTDKAIHAVEAYRRRKKPCAEVIDRALDIYTIEVEMLRGRAPSQSWTPKQCAEYAAGYLESAYMGDCATVRVLSAKRFVLQSHRENMEDTE